MFRLLELVFDTYRNGDVWKIFKNPWLLSITILLIVAILASIFIDRDFHRLSRIFGNILRVLLPVTP